MPTNANMIADMFQSSPAPKGGRYVRVLSPLMLSLAVSILARPEGRALRHTTANIISYLTFQSSPAPKGGRYRIAVQRYADDVRVSILARPEGRALRRVFDVSSIIAQVSILARPEGRALQRVHAA